MYEAAALDTLATVHRRDGRPGQALTCYREALSVVAQASHPHLEAQIQLGLAGTYRMLDRPDLAAPHAAQALAIARANDYRRLELQAMAALPERAGRQTAGSASSAHPAPPSGRHRGPGSRTGEST
jgi:hypothetical protein